MTKRPVRDSYIGILLLLFILTTVITYFPIDIVLSQIIIYALVCIVYIFSPKEVKIKDRWNVWGIIICFALILRIIIELEVMGRQQELYGSNTSLYFFLINGILLPILIIPRIKFSSFPKFFLYIASFVVLACLIVSLNDIISSQAMLSYDGRYSANESLGVIQYSQLSFTCSLIGFSLLYKDSKIKLRDIFYPILLIIIGLISIILAGTRSCLVSMLVILLMLLASNRPQKIIRNIIIAGLVLGVIILAFLKLGFGELFENLRLFRLFTEGTRDVSSGRFDLYKSAMIDILSNPIFGKSAFFSFNDRGDHITYIHNSILEITRAIGVVGGIIFVLINVYLFKKSVVILKYYRQYSFFVFLYIQYFIFSLFSESIFRIALYWFSVGMILCIIKNIRNEAISGRISICCNTDVRS